MRLVLLPGMDGTGSLYQPLLAHLPLTISVQVITFSETKIQSYEELVAEIKPQLPTEPFVLFAESFSGYLGYLLSLDPSINVQKVILVASFVSSPRRLLGKVVDILPIRLLFSLYTPNLMLSIFCLGKGEHKGIMKVLKQSLKSVDKMVLANRLRLILKLALPKEKSKVSCLVLNPTDDKLIPLEISSSVANVFGTAKVINLKGPHFLAQVAPQAVSKFVVASCSH